VPGNLVSNTDHKYDMRSDRKPMQTLWKTTAAWLYQELTGQENSVTCLQDRHSYYKKTQGIEHLRGSCTCDYEKHT